MLQGGVGLLRTMPKPGPKAVARLRTAAAALGISWPNGATPGAVIAAVDPAQPRAAAFVDQAAELLRGASYTAFDGTVPSDPGHGAVAANYAHVTAPLRRLADRYATEVCLALFAGRQVPVWARTALPRLPDVMSASDRLAHAAERGAIDLAEAVLLAERVGDDFEAAVLDADTHRNSGTVALDDPPVRARCEGAALPLGARITVRLAEADPGKRRVLFHALESPSGTIGV
jgi:exoribonuclease R